MLAVPNYNKTVTQKAAFSLDYKNYPRGKRFLWTEAQDLELSESNIYGKKSFILDLFDIWFFKTFPVTLTGL